MGEEGPVERSCAADEKIKENERERGDNKQRRGEGKTGGERALQLPPVMLVISR